MTRRSRRRAPRRPLRTAAALRPLLVLLVAGCSLPLPAGVHTPSKVAGQDQTAELQVLPQGPTPGQGANAAVVGFIAAQASPLGHYAIARQYLTGRAATDWSPDRTIRVFDPEKENVGKPDRPNPIQSNVQVTMTTIATVDSSGHYEPTTGKANDAYGLTKTAAGWRISSLPEGLGLQLSQTDLVRTFAVRNVYYLAPQQHAGDPRHLVPDRVFLPNGPDLEVALVQRLLTAPSLALAGSVSEQPSPSLSAVSVTSSGGVVTVTLTREAEVYDGAELRDLFAQLVWTLRQVPTFTGLRLRTASKVLRLDGAPEVEPASAFASYDPSGLAADASYYYLSAGRLRSSATPAATFAATGLEAIAVSPRGDRVAALRRRGGRDEVLLGTTHGAAVTTAAREVGLTSPTWGSGEVGLWMIEGGSRLVRVDPGGGGLQSVAVPVRPGGPLVSLAVSRDGVRAALVVRDDVYVGRIAWNGGAASLLDLHLVATTGQVQQVVWSTPTEIVVLLGSSTGARVVQRLAIDGSVPVPQLGPGLLSPTAITAAGGTVLVTSGSPSHIYVLGRATALQKGTQPVFPG